MTPGRRARFLGLTAIVVTILLCGLIVEASATQYAVVAHSLAGTVSVLKSDGGSWTQASSLTVGGNPWGLTTHGDYVYVAKSDGHVLVLRAQANASGVVMLTQTQDISLPAGTTNTQWISCSPSGDRLYVSSLDNGTAGTGSVTELSNSGGTWGISGSYTSQGYKPQGVYALGSGAMVAYNGGIGYEGWGYVNGSPATPTSLAGQPRHFTSWASGSSEFVFLTQPDARGISFFDAANPVLAQSVFTSPLSYSPYAATTIGDYMFVTDYDTANVYRYQLGLGTGGPTLTSGTSFLVDTAVGGIRQLAASADGKSLLITSLGGDSVYVVDPQTLSQYALAGSGSIGVASLTPGAGAVPEPSALAGMLSGLLAMGAVRRRMRRK